MDRQREGADAVEAVRLRSGSADADDAVADNFHIIQLNTPLIVQQTAPFQTINIKIYPVISWELIKRVDF